MDLEDDSLSLNLWHRKSPFQGEETEANNLGCNGETATDVTSGGHRV